MSRSRACARLLTVAVATLSALSAIGVPSAAAAPSTDGQGFVDSTARCTAPDVAAAYGSTSTSRVAICKSPGGEYEYRGVRVRDGAKLIVPAQSSDGEFTAENDGITYTVSPDSLVVSVGEEMIREEAMVDFHGPDAPADIPPTPPPTPLPPPLAAEVGGS